jgi:hypothetical protein
LRATEEAPRPAVRELAQHEADRKFAIAEPDDNRRRLGSDLAQGPQTRNFDARQIIAERSHNKLETIKRLRASIAPAKVSVRTLLHAAQAAESATRPDGIRQWPRRRLFGGSELVRSLFGAPSRGKSPGILGNFAYCSEFRSKREREPKPLFDIFAQNLSDFLRLPPPRTVFWSTPKYQRMAD